MRASAVFVVFVLGCGLGDYEKRMDARDKWVKYFDEENKLLDEPLEMPKLTVKTKDESTQIDGLPFEVFLRPPKDFKKEAGKEPYRYETVMLFRYPGGETGNLLLGGTPVAEKSGTEGETPDDFQFKAMFALREYIRKVYQTDAALPKVPDQKKPYPAKPMTPKGPEPDLTFDRYFFVADAWITADKERTKAEFWVYFHKAKNHQVVVVFQAPLEKSKDQERARAYSLKSLAIDPEKVGERKEQYGRFRFKQ